MKKHTLLVIGAFASLLIVATIIGCTGTGGILFPGGEAETKHLLVADYDNDRTLILDLPVSTNGNATVVLGQPDLTTASCNLTATGACGPNDATMDPSGNIWVADIDYCRVMEYKPPFTNGMAASVVIGEPDFTTDNCNGTGAADLVEPSNMTFDSDGNLWVTDYDNSRVFEFKPPFANGMSATLALGQPDLATTTCTTTATGLCTPWQGLVFDAQGNLWVSDYDNCRILRYSPPFSTGMAATLVIGQADFTSSNCGSTATLNDGPYGMAFDKDGNLWLVDGNNSRVLEFVPPFTNNMAASKVIGQTDLNGSSFGTTASTLDSPYDVSFDSAGNMYVADEGNNRVLVFAPPFATGMSATKVLGQADFTTSNCNTTANGLCEPEGVTAVP